MTQTPQKSVVEENMHTQKKSLLKQSPEFGRKKKRSLLMKSVGFRWQLEGTSASNPFWKTKSNASKGT